ncbi:PH domain-containing protein [Joostella sp. CR20]|uniref:PH domain-containing protein n=1 Tax=Joostella sp. CR20 TaxID=2804312 RepID=UPI00313E8E02
MKKTYKSKVSYPLLIIILIALIIPIITQFVGVNNDEVSVGVIALQVLIIAFVLHLFLKTTYTIDNTILKVKSGFISYAPIEINQITDISKTKSILSSPAPSFNRISIKYGTYNEFIISPKDQQNFIQDLKNINPNIKINIPS